MIVRVEKAIEDQIRIHKFPILDDASLSLKAKGLLTYLMGHGDKWECNEQEIAQHTSDGVGAIKTGLRELRDAGYLRREPKRDERGRVTGWISVITELPTGIATQWGVETSRRSETQKVENRPSGQKARLEGESSRRSVFHNLGNPQSGKLHTIIYDKDIRDNKEIIYEGEAQKEFTLTPPPSKYQFGHFITMEHGEHTKLEQKLGALRCLYYLVKLDVWFRGLTPRKRANAVKRSHYLTALNWSGKDTQEDYECWAYLSKFADEYPQVNEIPPVTAPEKPNKPGYTSHKTMQQKNHEALMKIIEEEQAKERKAA
jgi:hypothetical protein